MTAVSFFLAAKYPQSVAIDRIARWDEFGTPGSADLELDDALTHEKAKRNPRRKVVRALETALNFAIQHQTKGT